MLSQMYLERFIHFSLEGKVHLEFVWGSDVDTEFTPAKNASTHSVFFFAGVNSLYTSHF